MNDYRIKIKTTEEEIEKMIKAASTQEAIILNIFELKGNILEIKVTRIT